MDSPWIMYAVAGTLQIGLLMALWKVPAAKKINKYELSALSYFFASCIAGMLLFRFITPDPTTLGFAFLWGVGFAVLTLLQMHALHIHDTSGLYPFTSLASNVLVIAGGVWFLHESISPLQWLAVGGSVFIFIAAHWKNRMHFVANVLPLFAAIALLSTFNKFVQKIGADSVETFNFIFWQLVGALFAATAIFLWKRKRMATREFVRQHVVRWAALLGAVQFGSTYTIVKALSLGPISMVYVIIGLYTFFATAFAVILFKEKITPRAVVFVLLSFLIVLLIKLG